MEEPKQIKTYSIPLKEIKKMLERSEAEREFFLELIHENIGEDYLRYAYFELLCEGYSINNKMVNEIDKAIEDGVFSRSKKNVEELVLDEIEVKTFEILALSRYNVVSDLRRYYNISLDKH